MAKKECPSCAMEIDKKDDVCPICEYEFAETAKSRLYNTVIAILLLLLFLFALFWRLI